MNREEAFALAHQLSLSSSSSSSSEDDGEDFEGPRLLRPRMVNFLPLVDEYTNEEFRQNFRLMRETFGHLLEEIGPDLQGHSQSGRLRMESRGQLLLALWYFGTPDSYRSVCSRFGVGKATGHRAVRRVTRAFLRLAPTIIKWPTERGDVEQVVEGFRRIGFPDTIGAIDGSYIPIPKPKNNGRSYICRKNFAAINLTAVVDHQRLFTHVYAGEVGSTHDAEALRRSEVWTYIGNRQKFPNNCHIIGDKAYPLLPELMTPFRDNGHLAEDQRNFNYKLSRARSVVERAFGLLKGRWRCLLDNFDVKNLNWLPRYVTAICVLHNICILRNDFLDNMAYQEEPDVDQVQDEIVGMQLPAEQRRLGNLKRNRICATLADNVVL